jgi:hypothetical protein|tara:strand:+ start:266 stop:442 length:177 start_codon:yes stop_codon:yes gene_type:complete
MKTNKKFYEFITIFFAIIGTLAMVSAAGAVETDQWVLGFAAVSLGIGSFVLSIVTQQQ